MDEDSRAARHKRLVRLIRRIARDRSIDRKFSDPSRLNSRNESKYTEAEQDSTEANCPPLAINATPNHSLLSAVKTSLISNAEKAVANNIIKPAEVDLVENPLNCTIERVRREGYP